MDIQKIRSDFPILSQKLEGKPIIYLDSACMSLKPRQVIAAINEYYNEYPGCGGRSVHKISIKVTQKLDEAREKLKRFINAKDSREIIFTKNSTEGLNLVAYSLIFSGKLTKGDIVLTTDREHNSNLVPWHQLGRKWGIQHRVLSSNDDNTFKLEQFENEMHENRDKIKLVSMVHTSNLEGYTIPAEEIIKIAHENDALVMLDGAQSAAHRPIDIMKLDVDFFVFSVHKMCGPTGVGVLYGKFELLDELEPFIVGGETVADASYGDVKFLQPPGKFEAGLQNYAGQIGAGAAIEYLENIGIENIHAHEIELNKIMTEKLLNIPGLKLIGPEDPKLRAGIASFNIEELNSHDLAMILDEEHNIMMRSGMNCVHAWFNARKIDGAARASVYLYNTEDEVKFFAEKLEEIVVNFNK
ncbi:MAG: aminotransferase class V-fold PLP-dependent enzyme [Thermoplasmata archaeon]|nr:aminotransferase class V-fold PLP-dependent enzyme [Thermoplasmata archaeon]